MKATSVIAILVALGIGVASASFAQVSVDTSTSATVDANASAAAEVGNLASVDASTSASVQASASASADVSTPIDTSSALSSVSSDVSSAVSSTSSDASSSVSSSMMPSSMAPEQCSTIDAGAMMGMPMDAASLAAITNVTVIVIDSCPDLALKTDEAAIATLSGSQIVVDALARSGETGADVVAYSVDGTSLTLYLRSQK